MLISIKVYFEIILGNKFFVKPIQNKTDLVNTSNCKELYLDYKTLDAEGYVDVLPDFTWNVFQLDNKNAINKIQYNNETRTVIVHFTDNKLIPFCNKIEQQLSNKAIFQENEFCEKLEEALNEVLNS